VRSRLPFSGNLAFGGNEMRNMIGELLTSTGMLLVLSNEGNGMQS